MLYRLIALGLCLTVAACSTTPNDANNPLLQEWAGNYQGLPPFDKIKTEHFRPALKSIMASSLTAYEGIANSTESATFENTIVPMEQVDLKMTRVFILYSIWNSSMSDKEFQKVEKEMAPKMAQFSDKIYQNPKLFARVNTVYSGGKNAKLNSEQKRLVWDYYTTFKKQGASLKPEQKKRVAEINKESALLMTEFSQNLLEDEEQRHLLITDEKDLKGLPQWLVDSAKKEAGKRKMQGWVISNTRSSMQPFLIYSANRPLREKAFGIWTSRGEKKNYPVIARLLKLRAERSKLMGYKSYAHWQLTDKMAKTPEAAMKLLMRVWAPAKKQVRRDVAAMQKIVNQEKGGFKIKPWDYRYYAEKLRQRRYNFDMDSVKPYLQLPNIQKAMFWMAGELYGFQFEQITGVPVYHSDVTVFKVSKKGKTVGLWYFDPYARSGKRSGAWMNAYRIQHRLGRDTLPIVSNNSNFVKGAEGKPTLISWDDAETMFHEFGHALHGLSSNVTYPTLAGTRTARDFVEFPSQIHEDWLSTPEVLRFLKNEKGQALPKKLVKKLKRAANFDQGFATTEYLASALVDMKFHLTTKPVEPAQFEATTLKSLGMPKEMVMRHRTAQFAHIFSGEGYSAGYYSYMWSDVLRQDAFRAFLEAKGPYDKKVARRFQEKVLSVGNTVDPAKAYRAFRGRDPRVRALLESKGFAKSKR